MPKHLLAPYVNSVPHANRTSAQYSI